MGVQVVPKIPSDVDLALIVEAENPLARFASDKI
jgi:hypothetical protein